MDSKRPPPSSSLYLRVFFLHRRVFGFTDSVTSPFSGIAPESLSPEAETPERLSPELQTPDSGLFSSLRGYSSQMLDPILQTATFSTTSLPSTPSSTSSPVPSSPEYVQHYAIPAFAMDARDSIPTPASPNDKQKKISRPPNAFMIFRSWLIRSGKLPPGVGKCQQNVSKIAGKAWMLLDESSKNVWREIASKRLEDHKKNHLGCKSDTSPKKSRMGLEKIREAVKGSDDDTARRLKALHNVYAKDHRAVGLAASQRPRHGRTSPYKYPTTQRSPQKPARGLKTPRSMTGSQLASPAMSSLSLINFDSPSPSSVQSLSPLSLLTQPNAFARGMAQQPLPHMFFPPELPNHFQQAYQQEDGVCPFAIPRSTRSKLTESFQTVVFADNYAPVNPLAPPPGWYGFDHTGIVPPVVNTSEMMTGTASDNTATMLGLYELNPPYAHFNPNLDAGGSGPPVHQPPVPQMTNNFSTPLSTTPLTPREQEVFGAIFGNSRLPLTLEDLIPSLLSLPEIGFAASSPSIATPSSPFSLSTGSALPKEVSFAKLQTNQPEEPASVVSRSPAANQCA